MDTENKTIKAWAYARDFAELVEVLICQMTQLLGDAERQGIPVVGMSQDMHIGESLDRFGLKNAPYAINTGYANALFVHDIAQLSEDKHILQL